MALPLAPVAGVVLRYGLVAATAYAVARRAQNAPRDQRAEDAMDRVDEGMSWRREDDQLNANTRWRRVIRLGSDGPGIEIDATSISRIRFRKV
jgi:hypothetical protein